MPAECVVDDAVAGCFAQDVVCAVAVVGVEVEDADLGALHGCQQGGHGQAVEAAKAPCVFVACVVETAGGGAGIAAMLQDMLRRGDHGPRGIGQGGGDLRRAVAEAVVDFAVEQGVHKLRVVGQVVVGSGCWLEGCDLLGFDAPGGKPVLDHGAGLVGRWGVAVRGGGHFRAVEDGDHAKLLACAARPWCDGAWPPQPEYAVYKQLFKLSISGLINCMNANANPSTPSYPLADLCVLADLPPRTVRYYVQIGLVDRPQGETRAARYGATHLEQLLLIKKWTAAGVSLERIRELLHGEQAPVPPRARAIGSVEVRSHVMVADGVDLVIEPGRAGLSPEQVRQFIKGVMAVFAQVSGDDGGEANGSKAEAQNQSTKGQEHGPA